MIFFMQGIGVIRKVFPYLECCLMLYKGKICDIKHFRERITKCWEEIHQNEINRSTMGFRERIHGMITVE